VDQVDAMTRLLKRAVALIHRIPLFAMARTETVIVENVLTRKSRSAVLLTIHLVTTFVQSVQHVVE
jgi:hypothetical protein